MPKVKIMFMGYLSDFSGMKEAVADFPEKSTMKDLMKVVKEKYVKKFPKQFFKGEQFQYLHLMLNFQDIYEDKDADRQLSEGDVLYLIPPIGGGAY